MHAKLHNYCLTCYLFFDLFSFCINKHKTSHLLYTPEPLTHLLHSINHTAILTYTVGTLTYLTLPTTQHKQYLKHINYFRSTKVTTDLSTGCKLILQLFNILLSRDNVTQHKLIQERIVINA